MTDPFGDLSAVWLCEASVPHDFICIKEMASREQPLVRVNNRHIEHVKDSYFRDAVSDAKLGEMTPWLPHLNSMWA